MTIMRRVYPRACGGTFAEAVVVWEVVGLSPRLRGNRQTGGPLLHTDGSIPAPAGEPGPNRTTGGNRPVYPRACGGTGDVGWAARLFGGLSPRLRGNPPR